MRSSKSRSRSKSNRPRTMGNIINRVFDSSGPEGKVRGTPQQIIEKYLFLARDAQLSNDRVAAENFLQHAEHYTRMLGEAQRELAAEQEVRQQQGQNGQNGQQGRDRRDDRGERGDYRDQRPEPRSEDRTPDLGYEPQPEVIDLADTGDEESTLVETPEARPRPAPRREPAEPAVEPSAEAGSDAEARSDRGPRRPRGPRKPKSDKPRTEGEGPSGDGPREAAE